MALPRSPLTNAHKAFIIRKLAAFEAPRSIRDAFNACHTDATCNENDILAIDPENTAVSPDLHALFLATREAVLLDPKSAPFAEQKARLIALSNQAKFYGGNNQPAEQRAVFRQIAEELGVIGAKGKPDPKAADPAAQQVTKITRTVVDPVHPEPVSE